ncbi:hypothetical protein EV421DRAFT_732295 [Armillaria borealis]|uniref:Uncharacterized protein n=1 Tax=Armillaria borealis TaxID=47425 RepID=A0AA39JJ68_9AGAR|nr:hypothetical protein EV421DRAFT_732295 [Armillaria borealis]
MQYVDRSPREAHSGSIHCIAENHCLEFFGSHTFHEASVPFVREYVAGILVMQHRSDGAVGDATLRLHIDYIHNPHNLFTACSILATQGVKNIHRTAIHRDITTLVQLCPRDAAWRECRTKLHDLVQGDGGDFFSKQRIWLVPHYLCPLRTEEIQIEKDNIRYAIQVLDDFFDRQSTYWHGPLRSPFRMVPSAKARG